MSDYVYVDAQLAMKIKKRELIKEILVAREKYASNEHTYEPGKFQELNIIQNDLLSLLNMFNKVQYEIEILQNIEADVEERDRFEEMYYTVEVKIKDLLKIAEKKCCIGERNFAKWSSRRPTLFRLNALFRPQYAVVQLPPRFDDLSPDAPGTTANNHKI